MVSRFGRQFGFYFHYKKEGRVFIAIHLKPSSSTLCSLSLSSVFSPSSQSVKAVNARKFRVVSMSCCYFYMGTTISGREDPRTLASQTAFSVSEVEALFEVFKSISSSVVDDGLISKEEFLLAMFKNKRKKNLFANRFFPLFDVKHKGVVDFSDFVRSLNVFHPQAPLEDKIDCKVGDFGLARWQSDEQLEEETRVVGAFGYLAPEYTQTGLITEKADIYAFGIVLMEILTGIKATEFSKTSRQQYFPSGRFQMRMETGSE